LLSNIAGISKGNFLSEHIMTIKDLAEPPRKVKSKEIKALGFIIFLLFPIITITSISAYGFVIWMIQAFGGVVAH
jgi:nitrate reductase NapE